MILNQTNIISNYLEGVVFEFRAKIQVNNSEFQYHFTFNAIVVLWLFSNFSSSSFQFTQWEIVSLLYDPVINLMTQWDTFKIFCRANQEVNDELIHMSQPFSTDFKADVNWRKNALDFIIKIHDVFFAKSTKLNLMFLCVSVFGIRVKHLKEIFLRLQIWMHFEVTYISLM